MKVDWSSSKWDDPTHDQDSGRGNVRTGRLSNRSDGVGVGEEGGGEWEQEKVEPDSDLFSGSQMKVALLQREHRFGVGHGSFTSDVLSLRHASSRSRDIGWRYRLGNINSKKLTRVLGTGETSRSGRLWKERTRGLWQSQSDWGVGQAADTETGDCQYSRGRGLDW